MKTILPFLAVVALSLVVTSCKKAESTSAPSAPPAPPQVHLLNVSYDPTRELYADYNQVFAAYWKKQTGEEIVIDQSNGGSGKQARAVIDGLAADVVTLGLPPDIDAIVNNAHIIAPDWEGRLANNSTPYTSTIVFLVHKGNPKGIKDWPDLAKPGIEVVTPNPKTSGGARWNFLAAYGYSLQTTHDPVQAQAFVKALYGNVKVLDAGARGATVTFVERNQGDVLIAWENEALLTVNKLNPGQFEIVYPSQSILAEPPVAVVDKNVDAHGTRKAAEAYLNYLYSPEGQEVVARNYYRPRNPDVLTKYASQFPTIQLFTEATVFGSWSDVQKNFFGDGGIFDQIYRPAGQ